MSLKQDFFVLLILQSNRDCRSAKLLRIFSGNLLAIDTHRAIVWAILAFSLFFSFCQEFFVRPYEVIIN